MKRLVSDKLRTKSDKCKFVGYPKETIGYYFYHPIEKMCFSQICYLYRKAFSFEKINGSQIELEKVQEPQTYIQIEPKLETVMSAVKIQVEALPRRFVRTSRAPIRLDLLVEIHINVSLIHDEPSSYEEAMSDIDSSN